MTEITHHARVSTLADFAAGRLDEALAAVVAAHIAKCSECAETVASFEAVGGRMLDVVEPVAMATDALEKILARADGTANIVLAEKQPSSVLDRYLNGDLGDIEWKWAAPGIAQSLLDAEGYREGALRLFKIDPGVKIPTHTHGHEELTLILDGAYEDELGVYRAGDLADLDDAIVHAPKAIGDTPCICLVATSAPLRFKSAIGRIAQPFVGI
ncbi:MAG: ChrR family anti-sigma-E factor [Pseudomonadota bacterium]